MASYHATLRNTRAQAIIDFVDDAGLLRIYTAAYGTLLTEHLCGTPFAPAPSGGVITANAIADDAALADGSAAVARFYKADGTTIAVNNLTVSDQAGSGDVRLLQTGTAMATGQNVIVDSCLITEGNA